MGLFGRFAAAWGALVNYQSPGVGVGTVGAARPGDPPLPPSSPSPDPNLAAARRAVRMSSALTPYKAPDPRTKELIDPGTGFLVPPARTFSGLLNWFGSLYSSQWDEAVKEGREQARAMQRDAFFRALRQERGKPITRWKWEIEADPDDNLDESPALKRVGLETPEQFASDDPPPPARPAPLTPANGAVPARPQKDSQSVERERVRRHLRAVVRRTPRVLQLRNYLNYCTWFGRYGSQLGLGVEVVAGHPRDVVTDHTPVHGDKIQYDWDGTPGVMVWPGDTGRYGGLDVRYGGDTSAPLLMLDRPAVRERFVISRYEVEDADFFEPEMGGRVHGVGLRDYCYYAWNMRAEMLSWLTDFMEKVGNMGVMLFYYEEGNARSQAAAEASARQVNNRNALAVPVPKGADKQTAKFELVPANVAGAQFLTTIISDYFERHIERLWVGQSMSSGADGEGSLGGSGRAKFAEQTKFNLLTWDADNQAEVLTTDLVRPLQNMRRNFPGCPWRFGWKYRIPDPEAADRLANVKDKLTSLPVKKDDLYDDLGYERPDDGDDVVAGGMPGGGPPGMGPGGPGDGAPVPGGQPAAPPGNAAGPEAGGSTATNADPPAADAAQPGMAEVVAAMFRAAAEGDTTAVDKLVRLGQHRDELQGLIGDAGDDGPQPVTYAADPSGYALYGWDESQHPRADDGRFIRSHEIKEASHRPEVAEKLRAQVTDPAERKKLDRAIAGAKVPGGRGGELDRISHYEHGQAIANRKRAELVGILKHASARTGDPDRPLSFQLRNWHETTKALIATHYNRARKETEAQFAADFGPAALDDPSVQAVRQAFHDRTAAAVQAATELASAVKEVIDADARWAESGVTPIGKVEPETRQAFDDRFHKLWTSLGAEGQHEIWDEVEFARDHLAKKSGQPVKPLGRYFYAADVHTYAWAAARTKSGHLKAVWQGPGERSPLYGERAERALNAKHREAKPEAEADPAAPAPAAAKEAPQAKAKRLAAEREPAREAARVAYRKALADPASVRPEDLPALAAHLHTLTRDEIRESLRQQNAATWGKVKAELVEHLLNHVRRDMGGETVESSEKLPGQKPRDYPDDHDKEAEAAAEDKAGRMRQWASDKPSDAGAEAASRAADKRLAGHRQTSPGTPSITPPAGSTRPDGTPHEPKVEDVHTVPTKSLKRDPSRFQYKVSGIGEGGVTDELKGVKAYNPELGGTLLAWRDPETGEDYVVNGHHRHELADRTGSPTVNVRYVPAAEAKLARAKGALANIAEGRGTAVDAAKYLRDTGSSAEDLHAAGISLSGKVAADALHLRDLNDSAFQRLTEGRLDEGKALAVAKHLKDPALQELLFRKLDAREEDGKDWSSREVETAARKMAAAGKVTETGRDLFGEFADEKSTFDQEVELESHVGRVLAQEAGDYKAVASTRRAERVGDAGNVLNVGENQKRREQADQAADVFGRLVNRKGPIAEAVRESAAELAVAKTKREKDAVKQRTVERVRAAVAAELGGTGSAKSVDADAGGAGGGEPGRPAPPEPAGQSAPTAGRPDGSVAPAAEARPPAEAAGNTGHASALAAIPPGETAAVAGHSVKRSKDGETFAATGELPHTPHKGPLFDAPDGSFVTPAGGIGVPTAPPEPIPPAGETAARRAILTAAAANDLGGLSFADLYAIAKAAHPGLSRPQFRDLIARMHRAGDVTATGWAKSLDEIPDKGVAPVWGGKTFYWLRPPDAAQKAKIGVALGVPTDTSRDR